MSNQPEDTMKQTPEEVRRALLAEIDACKQEITDLRDEELEDINGGGFLRAVITRSLYKFMPRLG